MGRTMTLSDSLALLDEGTLSADEAQAVNEALSKAELKDIPPEKHSQVLDYLQAAFSSHSVEPNIQDNLDRLLEKLRGYN